MASENSDVYLNAKETVDHLRATIPAQFHSPKAAIICGSGLGGLASTLQTESKNVYNYASIPHFPRPTVEGHEGNLVFGYLGDDIPVVLMVGRTHFYEGYGIDAITFPIRVFKLLGISTLIVTNAAGGLNSEYAVGDIVVLNDHIFLAGLSGTHPLRGPNSWEFGPRFPPLSDAYDLELRRAVHLAWKQSRLSETKRRVHEGVYAYVGGPSYETRAECRMLRAMGADVVGMSTVPEIIVARHCGMRALAMSLVTNCSVLSPPPRGDNPLIQNATNNDLRKILEEGKADHEEVLKEGRLAAVDFQNLVAQVVKDVFPQMVERRRKERQHVSQ